MVLLVVLVLIGWVFGWLSSPHRGTYDIYTFVLCPVNHIIVIVDDTNEHFERSLFLVGEMMFLN